MTKALGHILPDLINDLGLKSAVEVGVRAGNLMARVVTNCPTIERYVCVDPWEVYIESYDRPPLAAERQQSWWESLYQRVKGIAEKYKAVEVMRMTSVRAAQEMEGTVDIVYIDAVHDFMNIVNDIYFWLPRIRSGGIISGHDWTKSYRPMAEAIEKIFQEHLNLIVIDPSKPPISYGNTDQGGNWWVFLEDKGEEFEERTYNLYSEYIGKIA